MDGLLDPVGDPDWLAGIILKALVMTDADRQRLTQAGRNKLKAQFSETAIVDAYLELYRRLCSAL